MVAPLNPFLAQEITSVEQKADSLEKTLPEQSRKEGVTYIKTIKSGIIKRINDLILEGASQEKIRNYRENSLNNLSESVRIKYLNPAKKQLKSIEAEASQIKAPPQKDPLARKIYEALNLGAYTDEDKKKMHTTKVADLSTKEAVQQLETYASWGMGTAFNQHNPWIKPSNSFEMLEEEYYNERIKKNVPGAVQALEEFQRTIKLAETIDCLDAGMPDGDYSEVDRCEEVRKVVLENYKTFQRVVVKNKLHNPYDEMWKNGAI